MSRFRVLHNPRCSKSRRLLELMSSEGVEFDIVRYLDTPLDEDELFELIEALDESAQELLRSQGETLSDSEVVARLVADPSLMQRPIVGFEQRAVIARPPESWRRLLA